MVLLLLRMRTICPTQWSRRPLQVFFQKFHGWTFRFRVYLEVTWVQCVRIGPKFIFFAYRCLIVPTPFVDKTVLSPLNCLCQTLTDNWFLDFPSTCPTSPQVILKNPQASWLILHTCLIRAQPGTVMGAWTHLFCDIGCGVCNPFSLQVGLHMEYWDQFLVSQYERYLHLKAFWNGDWAEGANRDPNTGGWAEENGASARRDKRRIRTLALGLWNGAPWKERILLSCDP